MSKKLTQKQIDKITKLLSSSTLTHQEIAERVGCGRSTVGRYAALCGIGSLKTKKPKPSKVKKAKIQRAVRRKKPLRKLGPAHEVFLHKEALEDLYIEALKKPVRAVRKDALNLPPSPPSPIFTLAFFTTVTLITLLTVGLGAYIIFGDLL